MTILSRHPQFPILGLVCLSILAIVLQRPLSLALLALLCISPWFLVSRLAPWRGRVLGLMTALVWSTAWSQGLFYADEPRVPWLRVGPVTVWREGLVHGFVQSLRLLSLAAAGAALAGTLSVDRLLAGLVALRVPWPLAFLAATAIRFLPEAGRELLIVRQARARRGRPVWQRSPWAWASLEASLLLPALARALRRARCLAESLETRGFDPLAPPTLWVRPLPWGLRLVAAAGILITAILAAARVAFLLYASDALWHPGLRGLYGFVRAWL